MAISKELPEQAKGSTESEMLLKLDELFLKFNAFEDRLKDICDGNIENNGVKTPVSIAMRASETERKIVAALKQANEAIDKAIAHFSISVKEMRDER